MESKDPKVVCVGLNKTGTSSIMEAWKLLGLKGIYDLQIYNITYLTERVINKRYKEVLEIASRYTCLKDRPWNVGNCYEVLDEHFTGSKFILTVRDEEEWWKSVHNWLSFTNRRHPTEEQRLRKIKLYLRHFESEKFDKESFIKYYRKYNDEVRDHFKGRIEFLEIDVCKGEGWERLCPFLGFDKIPAVEFPHVNKRY